MEHRIKIFIAEQAYFTALEADINKHLELLHEDGDLAAELHWLAEDNRLICVVEWYG